MQITRLFLIIVVVISVAVTGLQAQSRYEEDICESIVNNWLLMSCKACCKSKQFGENESYIRTYYSQMEMKQKSRCICRGK